MKTIKLSYTILNTWASKQFEPAVSMYLGKDIPVTPAMELGRLKHELWATHILDYQIMPDELGGQDLIAPVVEQKYEKLIPLGDKYQILLRGAPDCTDGTTIYEFKCGLATPTSYVDTLQLDYYKLLCPESTLGMYICFNPYSNTFTKGIKFLSDKNAETALEHVVTFGSEIIDYMATQKLLINYKPEVYLSGVGDFRDS